MAATYPLSFSRTSSRLLTGALLLFLATILGGCVEGPSPTAFLEEGFTARFSLSGDFVATMAALEASPINRIRVTATDLATGQRVGQEILDVDPNDTSWSVEIDVDIPAGADPQVVLTVELINVTSGVETVEWSGQTEPISVAAASGTTEAAVSVVRGPVDNLSVTGIAIISPELVRVGKTAALDATVAMSESVAAPQVYWTSLTPAIGSVSESGVFTALSAGTAEIQATAGAVSDVVEILVLPAIAEVVVEPTLTHAHSLGVELLFQATVLDSEGESIAGETVTWTVDEEEILENLGGGTFLVLGEGTAQVTATSDSEPTLSGTGTVEVAQVPVRVEVTPATATLEAVGATAQYFAEAFDAEDNIISWASFAWWAGDTGVATVDQAGLATAAGGGETEIFAEVLEPTPVAGSQAAGLGVIGKATLVVDLPLTMELGPTNATLPSIGATVQMIATALDGDGNKVTGLTYSWASSDPGVATVDANGLVTAVKDGETTITVTGSGATATAVVTVKQEVAALQWLEQPSDGSLYTTITPAPSVEAVDANGHRVTTFEGTVTMEAQYAGFLAPNGTGSATPTSQGPQKNVDGAISVQAALGVAIFSDIHMIDFDGYYRLKAVASIASVIVRSPWSVFFYMAFSHTNTK